MSSLSCHGGATRGGARSGGEDTAEAWRKREHADPEYQRAYALGRHEADEQWAAQAATIYARGLRDRFGTLDDETGLTLHAIAGCIVTAEVDGRGDGHNARIHELIAEHGPPAYSRLRFMSVLHDLVGYAGTVQATVLPNGPEVALEEMRVRVTRQKENRGVVGIVNEQKLFVWLGDRWLHGTSYGNPPFVYDYVGENASEGTVRKGPPGSDILIFVWRGDPNVRISAGALDLRSGEWLVVDSRFT